MTDPVPVVKRTLLGIISAPFLLIFWIYVRAVEFVLALDVVEDLRHTLLRYVHNKVIDCSETIVRIAPTRLIDSVLHNPDSSTYPGAGHEYEPSGPHDSRSPCPALNTLANHHFLPHDGRNIHPHQFIEGLRQGFNLTRPLAWFLTYGAYLLMHQWGTICLQDFARHSCIEHDASLAHRDCHEDSEYAPTRVAARILERLKEDSSDRVGLTLEDIARARVRREKESKECGKVSLDKVHAEIARGEMALVLDIFGKPRKDGELEIGIDLLLEWFMEERLPDGWVPQKKLGLFATIRTAGELRASMQELEKIDEAVEKKVKTRERHNTWRKDQEEFDFNLKKAFTDEKLQLDEKKGNVNEHAEKVEGLGGR